MKILDVGTGSGNIIISLAKLLRAKGLGLRAKFYASDISSKALKVARENAKKHDVSVQFVQSDLFDQLNQNFDIIIANLPYLSVTDYGLRIKDLFADKAGLRYEPQNALFTKDKGLFLIRQLLGQIGPVSTGASRGGRMKQKPRLVFLEFDPRQFRMIKKLARKYLPKAKIKFYKDLNGLWRYAEIDSRDI